MEGQIKWRDRSGGGTDRVVEGQIEWRDRLSGGTDRVEGQIEWRDRSSGGTDRVEGQIKWRDRSSGGGTDRVEEGQIRVVEGQIEPPHSPEASRGHGVWPMSTVTIMHPVSLFSK